MLLEKFQTYGARNLQTTPMKKFPAFEANFSHFFFLTFFVRSNNNNSKKKQNKIKLQELRNASKL